MRAHLFLKSKKTLFKHLRGAIVIKQQTNALKVVFFLHDSKSRAFCTSCSVVVHSPFLVFLMGGEESNVKLTPASCAHSDEIILLWIPLSFSKGVRVGAGD